MPAPISRLSIDVLLQSAQFQRDLQRVVANTNRAANDISRTSAMMGRGFDSAARSLKSFATGFLAIGSVTTLATAARQTFAWADALKEASQRIGVGVVQLQRLQRAGELTNVSQQQVTSNLEKFARGLGDAARGTGTLKKALEDTGIELRNSDGSLRTVSDVFDEYAARIANASSAQEALSLATAAFGRGGAAFVSTLVEMQESLGEFSVLTERQIEILGRYDDKIVGASQHLRYYFTAALAESVSALEIQGASLAQTGQAYASFIDELFGTNFAQAATQSVAELNTKLQESTALLQRYRDAQAQVAKGGAILQPGTLERMNELEQERIGLLAQLKRAAEDAGLGFDALGRAAAAAGDEIDDLLKTSLVSGDEGAERQLGSLRLVQKQTDAAKKAAQEQVQAAKQAAQEQERFERSRVENLNRELGQIAEQTIRRGQQAIAQQRKAQDDLNRSLRDQLSLQRLQLQGVDRESEEYRIHVALLEAKHDLNASLTAEQEGMIRTLEQQATAIDAQQRAAEEVDRAMAEAADQIADLDGTGAAALARIFGAHRDKERQR